MLSMPLPVNPHSPSSLCMKDSSVICDQPHPAELMSRPNRHTNLTHTDCPTRKSLISMIGCIVLGCAVACGGASPKEAVEKLEASGTTPKLDRSPSLAGVDSDANGVRDDVDQWILGRPVSEAQRSALFQTARALQKALTVDVTSDSALRALVTQQGAAVKCAVRRGLAADDMATIQALTANTKERALAYIKYNDALDGSVMESPAGDGCGV